MKTGVFASHKIHWVVFFDIKKSQKNHTQISKERSGMFGRDIRIEFYNEENPEETAGEYWCSDEDANDEEIGQAVIDECGFESVRNIDYYFDYEEYGRMMFTDGSYISTDNGYVECSDYDDSLGEDFEKELEEELTEDKGEQIL